MKYLFLLLISLNAFAGNFLPESEVIKAINLEPNAGLKTCEQLPEEKCHDWTGIVWEYAELFDDVTYEDGVAIHNKVLRNSNEKKAAHEALKLAEKEAQTVKENKKKQAKQLLKDADIDGATTIAKLKVIVKALLEAQE